MKSAVLFTLVFTLTAAGCASEAIVRRPDSCVQIERHRHSHTNRLAGNVVSDAELTATLRSERRSRADVAAARRLEIASLFTAAAALPASIATGIATYENRRIPVAGALTIDLGAFIAHAALVVAIGDASTNHFNHAVNAYNALAADLGRCPVPPPEPQR